MPSFLHTPLITMPDIRCTLKRISDNVQVMHISRAEMAALRSSMPSRKKARGRKLAEAMGVKMGEQGWEKTGDWACREHRDLDKQSVPACAVCTCPPPVAACNWFLVPGCTPMLLYVQTRRTTMCCRSVMCGT